MAYTDKRSLFSSFKSPHWVHHSTETVAAPLYNEIVDDFNRNEVDALLLLDSFCTTDHNIMIGVLCRRLDIRDSALDWL